MIDGINGLTKTGAAPLTSAAPMLLQQRGDQRRFADHQLGCGAGNAANDISLGGGIPPPPPSLCGKPQRNWKRRLEIRRVPSSPRSKVALGTLELTSGSSHDSGTLALNGPSNTANILFTGRLTFRRVASP